MQHQIDGWLRDVSRVTEQVQVLTAGLTPADITWQPASGVWSVAMIIEHLMKVNDSYVPAVADLRSSSFRLPLTAKVPGLPGLLGAMILKTVVPESRRRSRTFPVWEPRGEPMQSPIVGEFISNQDGLKALIAGSSDLLMSGALLCSPANRLIVYPLSTAFDIIVRHEERHLAQMLRTVGQRRSIA